MILFDKFYFRRFCTNDSKCSISITLFIGLYLLKTFLWNRFYLSEAANDNLLMLGISNCSIDILLQHRFYIFFESPPSSHLLPPLAGVWPGRPEREERLRAVGIIPRP